jgi:GTP cyclohydrolase I
MNDMDIKSSTSKEALTAAAQLDLLENPFSCGSGLRTWTPVNANREGADGGFRVSEIDGPRIERAVREILFAIGEDPDRDGIRQTPARVARAYRELLGGLTDDPGRHLSRTFEHESEQFVAVGGIDFSSTCEHHLLPFFGKAHVAYLPGNGRVVGLSKLARTVDVFARRLQLQERLTEQVADALCDHLSPRGVCVLVEAEHMCMRLRGACKPGTITTTLAVRGLYKTDTAARAEVLSLMRRNRN